MQRTYALWGLAAAALIFGPVGARMLTWQRQQPQAVPVEMASAGQVLFNHEWEANDPLCAENGGDGLGPVFNARSCAVCHHQNGPGGSGKMEHNVTTFLVEEVMDGPSRQGVVHAFATEPEFQESLFNLDANLPRISQPSLSQIVGTGRGSSKLRGAALSLPFNVQLAQRNTPALFGAGLIDGIPDQVIIANARRQQARHAMAPGDTETVAVGRVSRLPDGRIGRFGWKAQSATLSDFVQAACASELGLSNPGHEQPKSMAKPSYSPSGMDLTQLQCDQLTAFVASLSRPVNRPAAKANSTVHAGNALFSKIGCAECHTPSLGSVDGLYSDLLLHRMGTHLEGSNAGYGSSPPPTVPKSNIASPSSEPLQDEWRTPPLWGVADSAPYLHDGRAGTLEDAIRLHGGQASEAAKRFNDLNSVEKSQVLMFLKSLRVS